jgi:hypothetical protein
MNSLPWLSNVLGSSRNSVSGFSFASLALSGLLVCLSYTPSSAQTVSFSGTKPSVNFGDVNLCGPESQPAPCSERLALEYKVTASGTLGTPKVLTLGSPNLDFTLAEGSTCSGSVSAATTCTVKVQFVPKVAGDRIGAVQITDGSGKAIATTPIYGSGIGPQIAASLPQSKLIYEDKGLQTVPITAVDGVGDIFGVQFVDNDYGQPFPSDVVEVPVNGAPPFTLFTPPVNTDSEGGLAVDGAGNLFFNLSEFLPSSGTSVSLFLELPASAGATVDLTQAGPNTTGTIAVDGAGDLFVETFTNPPYEHDILKEPFGCETSSCISTIASTHDSLYGWAADYSGDLFLLTVNASNAEVLTKLPAGGGSPITIATLKNVYAGPYILGSLVVDDVGNLYAVASIGTSIGYQGYELVEFPAGSSTSINVGSLSGVDNDNQDNYAISGVDALGNVYINASYYESGIGTQYFNAEYQRSQFAPLNFGSVAVGTSKTLPLEVDNIGNRPLVLRPSFISPSYKVLGASPEGCLIATAPATSCTLSIEFRPLVKGPHTITLTLGSNGAADSVLALGGCRYRVVNRLINFSSGSSNPLSFTRRRQV